MESDFSNELLFLIFVFKVTQKLRRFEATKIGDIYKKSKFNDT